VGRSVGLDVHRDFCAVAILDELGGRRSGRVPSTPQDLQLFAESLARDDRVALEVTGNAWEIARILEAHVARVIVVSPSDTGIRQARAKTDRLDALALARLLAAGSLDAVWTPDEPVRVMRRRLARRSQLITSRSRVKNEVHAVLVRRLKGRPPCSDLFGLKGRAWLAELELPVEERETVDAGLRQIDFLDGEVAEVDRVIALHALQWPEIGRLMTVPGVNVTVAATFLAAVGDIRRFPTPAKLVGYLGLDPRVRQSGDAPAKHGRISKQGSAPGRHALVEAAWSTVRSPGPLRAFYQRVRARRGHQVAIVAAARKLACLFWCLLTRGEDYAYAQPSLTKKKLRRLELTAGAPKARGKTNIWSTNDAMRQAERALAEQAEQAYERTVADWQAAAPAKVGASATPGRASQQPARGQAARQTTSP
jgi:transposase